MNKSFEAIKLKDNWLVTIKDVRVCFTESDVYKLIRQEGMKAKEETRDSESNELEVIQGE